MAYINPYEYGGGSRPRYDIRGGGGGTETDTNTASPNTGFGLSANMGSGRGLGMAGAMLGLGIGVPGLGALGNVAGNLMDMSAANTHLSQLGVPGRIGILDAISPFTPSVINQMFDNMRAFDFGRDLNMIDMGFSDSPVGAPSGMGNFGGSDPGYGGSGSAGPSDGPGPAAGTGGGEADSSAGDAGGPSGDSSGAGDGVGGADFSKGGLVTGARLRGMNPPGPDDGFGALDVGEFVLSAAAVKKLGAKNAAKINRGRFDKKRLIDALLD